LPQFTTGWLIIKASGAKCLNAMRSLKNKRVGTIFKVLNFNSKSLPFIIEAV
jgi:hypothetical protein